MYSKDSNSKRDRGEAHVVCGAPSRRAIAALAVAAAAALVSQTAPPHRAAAQQEPRVIEPHFTRIFGTDSMEIAGAKMSPDGRWIVFHAAVRDDFNSINLWILPAAGGEPARLTHGDHLDDGAVWFPGSDQIAFRSDRPGPWAIMTLAIDNETGRPIGPPRQVTLEGSQAYLDVSPTGSGSPTRPRTSERIG